MDAVYILGNGSDAKNAEIKYSIRSLRMHMTDLRDVYVIGEKPEGIDDIVHIPAEDSEPLKWANALKKIKLACAQEEISDNFLLMNDDFFMLKSFVGDEFPFYAIGNSDGGPCGPIDFRVHAPIRINKEFFAQIPLSGSEKGHMSPRTMYANFYKAPPTMCNDFIVRIGANLPPVDEQVAGWPCFSISNGTMLESEMQGFLEATFPEDELETIE